MSHSRILQISDKPIEIGAMLNADIFLNEASWLIGSVADYVVQAGDRIADIMSFGNCLGDALMFSDNFSFRLRDGFKGIYFNDKFREFCAASDRLKNISDWEFYGKIESNLDSTMRKLNNAYNDERSFYVAWYDGEDEDFAVQTLDEFIRSAKADTTYYIGATLDYHY